MRFTEYRVILAGHDTWTPSRVSLCIAEKTGLQGNQTDERSG
jgi:hypothetical protein